MTALHLAAVGILLLATARPGEGESPAVTVEARVTPTEVTVGQSFSVELRVTAPEGTRPHFPEGLASDTLELVPISPGRASTPPHTAQYRGRCFTLHEAAVPPLTVRFQLPDGSEGEARSQPVPLHLVSALPKGEENPSLADVAAPVGVPVTWLFLLTAAGIGTATIATLVALLRRRRAHPSAPPPVPAVPPDQEALAALAGLAQAGVLEREDYRAFYIALMEIVKRYLERRLAAPVLEMTSTEMVSFLRHHRLGKELVPLARELAAVADQVKFARGSAQRSAAERHLAEARGLVAALEQRLSAEQGEGAAGRTA